MIKTKNSGIQKLEDYWVYFLTEVSYECFASHLFQMNNVFKKLIEKHYFMIHYFS